MGKNRLAEYRGAAIWHFVHTLRTDHECFRRVHPKLLGSDPVHTRSAPRSSRTGLGGGPAQTMSVWLPGSTLPDKILQELTEEMMAAILKITFFIKMARYECSWGALLNSGRVIMYASLCTCLFVCLPCLYQNISNGSTFPHTKKSRTSSEAYFKRFFIL